MLFNLQNLNELIHLFFCRDGFFFAVKEVSLLDQGSQAQQCIQQLEQVRNVKITFKKITLKKNFWGDFFHIFYCMISFF